MINFRCPKCNKAIRAPDRLAGRKGKCPGCGTVCVVRDDQVPVLEADEDEADLIVRATANLPATISLMLGIASVALCAFAVLRAPAMAFGIAAIPVGIFGLMQARRVHGAGNGIALTATLLGVLSTTYLGFNTAMLLRQATQSLTNDSASQPSASEAQGLYSAGGTVTGQMATGSSTSSGARGSSYRPSPSGRKVKVATQSTISDTEPVDRNPHGETVTGQTATGIPTFTGPRGGTYHYSPSGRKVYERKR